MSWTVVYGYRHIGIRQYCEESKFYKLHKPRQSLERRDDRRGAEQNIRGSCA